MAKFEKGKSGNPNGRPRTGKSFAEIMRKVIDAQKSVVNIKDAAGNVIDTKTIKGKEVVATAIMQIALDRKNNPAVRLTAFNTALDRAYGRPLQEIDMAATVSNDRTGQIKASLDRLSPERRQEYMDLCAELEG